jgi:hypothetical protein
MLIITLLHEVAKRVLRRRSTALRAGGSEGFAIIAGRL